MPNRIVSEKAWQRAKEIVREKGMKLGKDASYALVMHIAKKIDESRQQENGMPKKNPRTPRHTPRIYVENMRTNKGDWVDVDSDVKDAVASIAKDDDWLVADYEYMPSLGQHPSLDDLELYSELADEHPEHVIKAALDITRDVEEAKEYLDEGYGEYESEQAYAEELVDEGAIDTKTLLNYIDYEALGRDIAMDVTSVETKNGIVVFNKR